MTAEQQPGATRRGACLHCGRRCHVPVARSMPDHVRQAYDGAGRKDMATCQDGAAADHRELGVSYADVIAARVREVAEHPVDWTR
jgi:hypothetical protein